MKKKKKKKKREKNGDAENVLCAKYLATSIVWWPSIRSFVVFPSFLFMFGHILTLISQLPLRKQPGSVDFFLHAFILLFSLLLKFFFFFFAFSSSPPVVQWKENERRSISSSQQQWRNRLKLKTDNLVPCWLTGSERHQLLEWLEFVRDVSDASCVSFSLPAHLSDATFSDLPVSSPFFLRQIHSIYNRAADKIPNEEVINYQVVNYERARRAWNREHPALKRLRVKYDKLSTIVTWRRYLTKTTQAATFWLIW